VSDQFMSEIRMFTCNFAPRGWAIANGQTLPINQNQALFSLLGTYYGGNGQTTFNLPNLQGKVPIHFGRSYTIGQQIGEYAHTLTQQEMPTHNHFAFGSPTNANQPVPNSAVLGTAVNVYRTYDNLTPLQTTSISMTGGSQPHNNTQPYLVLNFCIALVGVFPSQS
jgi:microcystin-dependent protein